MSFMERLRKQYAYRSNAKMITK